MLIKPLLILAILSAAAIGLWLTRKRGSARTSAYLKIAMGFFVLFAIYAIILPEHVQFLATLIGVGRGTDLLLYILFIVFTVFVVYTYARFIDMESKIARLSRAIALASAPTEHPAPPQPASLTAGDPADEQTAVGAVPESEPQI